MKDRIKIKRVLEFLNDYAHVDDKEWVINQMVEILTEKHYNNFVKKYEKNNRKWQKGGARWTV